jgi:hypothetical protein
MRRIIEDDERPHEEIEHTREAYATTADLVRAWERSGLLRTEEEKGIRFVEA